MLAVVSVRSNTEDRYFKYAKAQQGPFSGLFRVALHKSRLPGDSAHIDSPLAEHCGLGRPWMGCCWQIRAGQPPPHGMAWHCSSSSRKVRLPRREVRRTWRHRADGGGGDVCVCV